MTAVKKTCVVVMIAVFIIAKMPLLPAYDVHLTRCPFEDVLREDMPPEPGGVKP